MGKKDKTNMQKQNVKPVRVMKPAECRSCGVVIHGIENVPGTKYICRFCYRHARGWASL